MIKVVKKDGTKEDFNVQKVVIAVNKSAYRALIKFTDEELDCRECSTEYGDSGNPDCANAQCGGRRSGKSESNRCQELSGLPQLQAGLCSDVG